MPSANPSDSPSSQRPEDCLAQPGTPSLPIHAARPETLDATLAALGPHHAAFLRAAGFTAASGQRHLLPGENGLAAAIIGLGADRSPYTHGALPFALPPGTTWHLEPGDFDQSEATLGWLLGAYRFTPYKAPKRPPALLALASPNPEVLSCARATWLARDLINTPANHQGPAELAAAAQALATSHGAAIDLIQGETLTREYPTIAAVGAGSTRPPVVARFTWSGSASPPGAPLISLCGKGVVFDSGGYDIKPPAGMLRMKKDMGGAALMLALASMIMDADLPLRLEVRIGCLENSISGHAMRPSDIVRTRRGLTVEIGNTDAEGRLLLADLLAEASDQSPTLLIDASTLTGAARVALGPDIPVFFTNEDEIADAATHAALARHDPVWRLPLHAPYDKWLDSPIADLNNVASKPMAGAIVAALFLQRFLAPATPWLHLDTYAWNDQTRPGRPEGGEALGLRTLVNMIKTLNDCNVPRAVA